MVICATLAFGAAVACAGADNAIGDTSQPPDSEQAPSSAVSPELRDQRGGPSCLNPSGPQLTGAAAGLVRIGATASSIREQCVVVADTSLALEGEAQPAILVEVGSDTVLAEIVGSRVWRVRVRSAGLRTEDSVGVGTPARRLLTVPDATVMWGEGNHVIISPIYCGLSFQLDGRPPRARPWTTAEVAEMPDSVRVSQVLVVGSCHTPSGSRILWDTTSSR